jgi:hypothetical protein
MAASTAQQKKSLSAPLAAFAIGAVVAILVGVFGREHHPSTSGLVTLGFPTVIAMKIALSVLIAVGVVVQLLLALRLYGKLGHGPAPSWVGPTHRAVGTLTLLLSVFVAYNCLWALGLESGYFTDGQPVPVRTVVHGVLGCLVIGAMVVKLIAVRAHRAPGWFLPLAGGLLFTLLVAAVVTSSVWYLASRA